MQDIFRKVVGKKGREGAGCRAGMITAGVGGGRANEGREEGMAKWVDGKKRKRKGD
jgi:hypothetical protein